MRKIFVVALIAFFAVGSFAPLYATYGTATVMVNEPRGNGLHRLVVRFTGNAGEPAVDRETVITGTTTLNQLRQWAIDQISDIQAARTLAGNANVQVGQSINLTPIPPPSKTAQEIWHEKAERLVRLKALTAAGLTNATAVSEINALATSVNDTYVSGYADSF